jgi:hypothetical protein
VTHEGAPARFANSEQQLRRAVMACLLWEDQFYESGETIADRIKTLVKANKPEVVARVAREARTDFKLRHAPLLVTREAARHDTHKHIVADTLEEIIQRPDELAEFLAIYWREGKITKKTPISSQIKKGLARAFTKFDEYSLAKYDREGAIRLRDVLFLCHAKPKDMEQAALWKRLVDGEMKTPDTWEVGLSAGKDKKAVFGSLLSEGKLGALALLRNLRNMQQAGVSEDLIREGLKKMRVERVLPFRFISAAKYAPRLEPELEQAMFKCLEGAEKLPGKTVLLVDTSGSMDWDKVSSKSELTRREAAAALAMLAREVCEDVQVYAFENNIHALRPRRGFALRDEIMKAPTGGTNMGAAVKYVNAKEKYDRLIVFTDEQSHDAVPAPNGKGYIINVASYKNGVGYGPWTHIDGFSESTIRYIQEYEKVL